MADRRDGSWTDGGHEWPLAVLADCLEMPLPEDAGDEHRRWDLYRRAIPRENCHSHLLTAVLHDPDDVLVASVVVQMLEWVDASDRERWIESTRTERDRRYASRRAAEIDILRSASIISTVDRTMVDGWSDWLQIRLAETSTDVHVLDQLARSGRTRKTRRTAVQRRSTL